MVLIGLSGRKGSGKNTAASAITAWGRGRGVHVVEKGFADKLKLSAARLFVPDISQEEAIKFCDGLKTDGTIEMVHWNDDGTEALGHVGLSGREFLQRYGTEAHREVFGDNFWVDQLLPYKDVKRVRAWSDPETNFYPDIAVITDCRFENEAKRINDLGGLVWEVQRPGLGSEDDHASEQPLPRKLVDYVFRNDSTIEDLMTNVNSMMTGEFHMRFLTHDPL